MESVNDQSMNTSKTLRNSFHTLSHIDRFLSFTSHIFWIGDLNYRIMETQGRNEFDEDNYLELLKMDQLLCEMRYKRVFHHYSEGIIRFRPTYKYDPGTDNWDSSEKHRAPAWCDRILWKGERIQQLVYESVMRLQLSDHKPVYSIFLCDVSVFFAAVTQFESVIFWLRCIPGENER